MESQNRKDAMPEPDLCAGRTNIGGRWWRCDSCGRTFAADCECCEPPVCCPAVPTYEATYKGKAVRVAVPEK